MRPFLLEEKIVCSACVGDVVLSGEIDQSSEEAICPYCASERSFWTLRKLADRVDPIFARYVVPGEFEPDFSSESDRVEYEQQGDPPTTLMEGMLGCRYEVADDLVSLLSDDHDRDVFDGALDLYDPNSSYKIELNGSGQNLRSWQKFCNSLRSEARFFNRDARDILDQIIGSEFKGVLADAVTIIGTETDQSERLYRARFCSDERQINEILANPGSHFGPPPEHLRNPGRMNAAGIVLLYLAFEEDTAVAEVRPTIGSHVVVGVLRPLKPLRLLDLSKISSKATGSYFRTEFERWIDLNEFFSTFSRMVSLPARAQSEVLDYLPTQCLAEYLAREVEPRFDGIVYSSALKSSGRNVAIFAHAASIQTPASGFPVQVDKVELSWSHPDEPPEYLIEVDSTKPEVLTTAPTAGFEVLVKEMGVHHIASVEYSTMPFDVRIRETLTDDPGF